MTRRDFLSATLAGPLWQHEEVGIASGRTIDLNRLTKFVDPLKIPPVARTSESRASLVAPGRKAPVYRLEAQQIRQTVHRDLPPARMWGVGSSVPGLTVEARSNQPIFIEWVNSLPQKHLLPVDHSLPGAEESKPDVRTIFHVHGARARPESDGYPENWFTPSHSLLSFYHNEQDATALWYHDHTMAITRLNTFAGLFGLYLIRDDFEDSLGLPSGSYEVPLVLCDRSFRPSGDLFYPVSPNPSKPWVSEFLGDAILANGTLFPFLNTEPRKYRFRVVNASNSRFLYLSLSNRQEFWRIGADQGLLPAPISMGRITLAPGERADLIIDFAGQRGENVVLQSDNFSILQFRISKQAISVTAPLPPRLRPFKSIPETEAAKTRLLALESPADSDDLMSLHEPMLLNGAHWHDPITEDPCLDSTEIWSFINLTDDSHPIHLHLVRFQILDRRSFDVFTYLNDRQIRYTAPAVPPGPDDTGWKDTVRAHPGMVTRIIIRFEGFAGRYVWHCHVLEHEDFEMMRPYDVLPARSVK